MQPFRTDKHHPFFSRTFLFHGWFMLVMMLVPFLSGCEVAKVILGTSTRHLEKKRVSASLRTYACSFDECFDGVLSLAANEVSQEPVSGKRQFSLFQKDRIQSFIVFMGIPGHINTTEAGVFFVMLDNQTIQVEVTSLSSAAQQKVARAVFKELDARFQPVLSR